MTHSPNPQDVEVEAREVLATYCEKYCRRVVAESVRVCGAPVIDAAIALSAISSVLAERNALKAAKWDVKHVDTMNDMVAMGITRDAAEAEVKSWRENMLYLLNGNGPDVIRSREGGAVEDLIKSTVLTLCATRNSRNVAQKNVRDMSAELSSYRSKAETAEAEVARLREALERIEQFGPACTTLMVDGSWREALRDLQRIARAALTGKAGG